MRYEIAAVRRKIISLFCWLPLEVQPQLAAQLVKLAAVQVKLEASPCSTKGLNSEQGQ